MFKAQQKYFVSNLYFIGVRVGQSEFFLMCACFVLFYTLPVAWTSHLKSRHKLGTKHEHSNHLENKKVYVIDVPKLQFRLSLMPFFVISKVIDHDVTRKCTRGCVFFK
jgi:hypothetical protein